MKYKDILKHLAMQENVSEKQIKNEMREALRAAGLNCSPKEFIESTSKAIEKRLYIV